MTKGPCRPTSRLHLDHDQCAPKDAVELGDSGQLLDRGIAADPGEESSFALDGRQPRRRRRQPLKPRALPSRDPISGVLLQFWRDDAASMRDERPSGGVSFASDWTRAVNAELVEASALHRLRAHDLGERSLKMRSLGGVLSIRSGARWALLLTGTALLLAACAAGPNELVDTGPDPAGFWLGLWQGLISPITFIMSLFTPNVSVYEVQNNGNWYDFGFMLGVACAFGSGGWGGTAGTRRTRKRRSE